MFHSLYPISKIYKFFNAKKIIEQTNSNVKCQNIQQLDDK